MNRSTWLTAMALGVLTTATTTSFFACDSGPDGPPGTSEFSFGALRLYADVQSNGEQLLVSAYVQAEDRAVTIDGDDELELEDDAGARSTLRAVEPNVGSYAAMIDSAAEELSLVLRRGSTEQRGELTLPEPFALVVELSEGEFGQSLDLRWEPGTRDDAMSVLAYGSCLVTAWRRDLPSDVGSYSIQPGELQIDMSFAPCSVAVELTRRSAPVVTRAGQAEVSWSAAQVRTAEVRVQP